MRYLNDDEILKWGDRLQDSSLMLLPVYNSKSGYPGIRIVNRYGSSLIGFKEEELPDAKIKYQFIFSIVKNRESDFFDILNRLIENGFDTDLVTKEYNSLSANQYLDKSHKILIKEDIIESKKQVIHNMYNRDFIRYTYNFSGKLSEIIAYVTLLEDTINYFSMIWSYDEEGKEHCLVKYPIGSVVSMQDDKSKDYLIIDYVYFRLNNKEYKIDYMLTELLNDSSSSVIKYGKTFKANDDMLCFSRNNRIDNILN
jgi:hypothetical protein